MNLRLTNVNRTNPRNRENFQGRDWLSVPRYKLDPVRCARCACHAGVTGEKHGIQGFCECDVCRTVGAEIFSELPYPIEKRLVSVAVQVEIVKIVDGLRRFRECELALPCVAPKRLRDLHINKVWRVQTLP